MLHMIYDFFSFKLNKGMKAGDRMREILNFRSKYRSRVDQDSRSLGLIEAQKERTMRAKVAHLYGCNKLKF